jgi:hypothetical protein
MIVVGNALRDVYARQEPVPTDQSIDESDRIRLQAADAGVIDLYEVLLP